MQLDYKMQNKLLIQFTNVELKGRKFEFSMALTKNTNFDIAQIVVTNIKNIYFSLIVTVIDIHRIPQNNLPHSLHQQHNTLLNPHKDQQNAEFLGHQPNILILTVHIHNICQGKTK